MTVASRPGHVARWGWGRGTARSAESAAPHIPVCPGLLPGKDAGEASAPLWGAVPACWGLWKAVPATSAAVWILGHSQPAPGAGGAGLSWRGWGLEQTGPFQTPPKRETEKRPLQMGGSTVPAQEVPSQHQRLPSPPSHPITSWKRQDLSRSGNINTRGRWPCPLQEHWGLAILPGGWGLCPSLRLSSNCHHTGGGGSGR